MAREQASSCRSLIRTRVESLRPNSAGKPPGKRCRPLYSNSHTDEASARSESRAKEAILQNYSAGALANALEAREALDLRLRAGQSNVLEVLAGLRSITRTRVRGLQLKQDSTIARFRAAVAGAAVLNDPSSNDSEKDKK